MIKCEVQRDRIKMEACGTPLELIAEAMAILNRIYARTLAAVPQEAEEDAARRIRKMIQRGVEEGSTVWERGGNIGATIVVRRGDGQCLS